MIYGRILGLRWSPKVLALCSAIVVAAMMTLGHVPKIAFLTISASALCAVLSIMVTFRGASVWQWHRIRREGSSPLVFGQFGSHKGVGWVWDGNAKHAWIEVSPGQAMALTTVSAGGSISEKFIDLPRLAKKVHQRDIVCDSIRVVTHAYRSALPVTHPASAAVSDAIGPAPVHINGRTFAVVSLSTIGTLAAVRARARAGGINETVWEAASRVRVELEAQGFTAKAVTEDGLRTLAREQTAVVAPALEHIHKTSLGDSTTMKVFNVVAQGDSWSTQSQHLARQIPAYRVYENLAIVRDATGSLRAGYTASFVSPTDRITRALKGAGLRTASGQQASVLAQTLTPAAMPAPVIPLHPLSGKDMPVAYPGGAGMYLGASTDLGRCFLRVDPWSRETLWLCGSQSLAHHMVLRMILSTAPISIQLQDNDPNRQGWEQLVHLVSSPLLTLGPDPMTTGPDLEAGIVVCAPHDLARFADTGHTVICHSGQPAGQPEFSIVETGGNLVCTTGHNQVTVPWSMTAEERRFIPAIVHAAADRTSIK